MDEPIKKTQESARQGNKGRPVLYVLIGSLVLLGIYMIGLMTWSSRQGGDYAGQSQESSRAQVTGSTTGSSNAPASSNTSGVPAGNPAYPAPATRDANTPAPKP